MIIVPHKLEKTRRAKEREERFDLKGNASIDRVFTALVSRVNATLEVTFTFQRTQGDSRVLTLRDSVDLLNFAFV